MCPNSLPPESLDSHIPHDSPSKSNVWPSSRSRTTSQSPGPPNKREQPSTTEATSYHGSTTGRQESSAADASIVLIGMRGTGKSSLAIIASSALRFRLVDADQHFQQHTGLSRATFNAKHGLNEYRRRELQIMQLILSENQTRCVITCGPGSVEGDGQSLLKEYATTHPVIYIMRDTEDIQRHLRIQDAKKISDLIDQTGPMYRVSSSFEFYNISENSNTRVGVATNASSTPRSLALKKLQQDFLQLIRKVITQASRHAEGGANTHWPQPPESRPFTYALTIPISSMRSTSISVRDIETTADAVELIIDLPFTDGKRIFNNSVANNISKQYYTIRRYMRIPIIFQVQPSAIQLHGDAHEIYFELLQFGLRLAPEYLCVDITCNDQRIKSLLTARGSTKIIGHFFDPAPGVDGWASQDRKAKLKRARDLGCDIVRLCQQANSMLDNISVQRFAFENQNSDFPLIAYNSGPSGRISCWQNAILTPVTHSVIRSHYPSTASDDLLTLPEAQKALYASFTLDQMKFGIFGSAVGSSLSPAMHNGAFKFCGMPHVHKPYQSSSLKELETIFWDLNFGGGSITAPFKQEIVRLVDFMSPEARAIGAVNTLIPLRSKKLESLLDRNRAGPVVAFYGANTDWIGIHTCISRNLSPVNTVNEHTTGLVLGAGGTSRAAVFAMIRLGIRKIFIHNRTTKKAEQVAKQFKNLSSQGQEENTTSSDPAGTGASRINHHSHPPTISVLEFMEEQWPSDADPPTIVVSSIPGRNAEDQLPITNRIPPGWLASKTGGVVIELAYDPLETALLKQARERANQGWIAVEGLQVLPEQGIPQFEIFTGQRAPRQQMRKAALQGYEEQQRLKAQCKT